MSTTERIAATIDLMNAIKAALETALAAGLEPGEAGAILATIAEQLNEE